MVDEYTLNWVTPGGGGRTTLYTRQTGDAQTITNSIRTWAGLICQGLSSQVSVTPGSEVRRLDTASGVLTGVFSVTPGTTIPGNVSQQPVADASQVMLRWGTGTIINGRRLVGRTFLPGLPVGSLSGGNIAAATVTDFANKAQALVTALAGTAPVVVWHRPVNGAGGSDALVTGGTCWSEVAVLRRRRG
jgi:hypothetical protein